MSLSPTRGFFNKPFRFSHSGRDTEITVQHRSRRNTTMATSTFGPLTPNSPTTRSNPQSHTHQGGSKSSSLKTNEIEEMSPHPHPHPNQTSGSSTQATMPEHPNLESFKFPLPLDLEPNLKPEPTDSKFDTTPQTPSPALSLYLTPPSSPPTPTPTTILETALSLSPIQRFSYLLTHTSILIQLYGPYFTNKDSHLTCVSHPRPILSEIRFAKSLAAAQDCLKSQQPEGPVLEDLKIFVMLWETTLSLLEGMLEGNVLNLETFGWGIYGLSSGYIHPSPTAPDQLFLHHRQRLYIALVNLPGLHKKKRAGEDDVVRTKGKDGGEGVLTITTSNRSVHICAIMLLQSMRREGWGRVRWGHGVRMCERWLKKVRWSREDETGLYGRGKEEGVEKGIEGVGLGEGGGEREERSSMHDRSKSME